MALAEMVSKKLELESKWATQALKQGKVTPDMKWIDIAIKNLKVKINTNTVEEVKKEFDIAS